MFFRKVLIPLILLVLIVPASLAQDQSQPSSTQPSTSKPDPSKPEASKPDDAKPEPSDNQRRFKAIRPSATGRQQVKHDGRQDDVDAHWQSQSRRRGMGTGLEFRVACGRIRTTGRQFLLLSRSEAVALRPVVRYSRMKIDPRCPYHGSPDFAIAMDPRILAAVVLDLAVVRCWTGGSP